MCGINLLNYHVTQIKTTQKVFTQRTFYLTMLLFIETQPFLNQEIFFKKPSFCVQKCKFIYRDCGGGRIVITDIAPVYLIITVDIFSQTIYIAALEAKWLLGLFDYGTLIAFVEFF